MPPIERAIDSSHVRKTAKLSGIASGSRARLLQLRVQLDRVAVSVCTKPEGYCSPNKTKVGSPERMVCAYWAPPTVCRASRVGEFAPPANIMRFCVAASSRSPKLRTQRPWRQRRAYPVLRRTSLSVSPEERPAR
jgi:hypothetical protein